MRVWERIGRLFVPDAAGKFYRDVQIVNTIWLYSWCHEYPNLFFAHVRVFSNGTADARFQDESKVFGFDSEDSATNFVQEDEFSRLEHLDNEERELLEIPADVIVIAPDWKDLEDFEFEYIGKY